MLAVIRWDAISDLVVTESNLNMLESGYRSVFLECYLDELADQVSSSIISKPWPLFTEPSANLFRLDRVPTCRLDVYNVLCLGPLLLYYSIVNKTLHQLGTINLLICTTWPVGNATTLGITRELCR